MIISTTQTLEGKKIKEYKGIVFGEIVSGNNMMMVIASGTAVVTE